MVNKHIDEDTWLKLISESKLLLAKKISTANVFALSISTILLVCKNVLQGKKDNNVNKYLKSVEASIMTS